MNLLNQALPLPPLARPVIIGVALVYFAVVLAIAVWAMRRTKNARDFYVAGQRLGLTTMAIAAMAASLSGFAFIGGPGLVYTLGVGGMFVILPLAVTNTLGAWALAKRLRLLAEVRTVLTIPDVIGIRYRSRTAQGLAAVAIVVAVVGYMATNMLALGLVIDVIFGVGLRPAIWIGAMITLAYSVAGGILAGVYTDVFQGTIMAAASLVVFGYVLSVGGGMSGITTAILNTDPAFMSPFGKLTPLAALSLYFVFGIGALAQPHVVHKFFMLKDPLTLKWYPAIMTVAMTLTLLLFFGVGLVMRALVARGEIPALVRADDATPLFLLQFTPVVVAALAFAGVAAAIMSTVNSFLSIGAAALTHDLPTALGRPVRDELLWGRMATVLLAIIATVVATESQTLVAFLAIFGWGLFASTLVPALAIGMNWTGATPQGAVASIATGLSITLVLETLAYARVFTFPSGVTATALALVCSLAVFFIVSWVTRAHAPGSLDDDVRVVMEV